MKTNLKSIAWLVAGVLVSSVAHAALPTYQITDLGDLPTGENFSFGQGLNDLGQVVGYSYVSTTSSRNLHAFIWSAGSGMQDLGDLSGGDDESVAYGINNAGQVTGYGKTTDGYRAFVWSSGTGMQALGVVPGERNSAGYAINSSGTVVGASIGGSEGAFRWTAGDGMQNLGTLAPPGAGHSDYAYAINDVGQIVGASSPGGAFMWSSGAGIQALGGNSIEAAGINNAGWVVGSFKSGGGPHAFLWQPGIGMTDLTVGSGSSGNSHAYDINESGQAVGDASFNASTEGFLWTADSGMVELNTLIDPNDPFYGTVQIDHVRAINNAGQIVGRANFNQFAPGGARNHAILLTPIAAVPEPEAWAMLMAGLWMTGVVLRRRRSCDAT